MHNLRDMRVFAGLISATCGKFAVPYPCEIRPSGRNITRNVPHHPQPITYLWECAQ